MALNSKHKNANFYCASGGLLHSMYLCIKCIWDYLHNVVLVAFVKKSVGGVVRSSFDSFSYKSNVVGWRGLAQRTGACN